MENWVRRDLQVGLHLVDGLEGKGQVYQVIWGIIHC